MRNRRKRSVNGSAVQLTVELGIITDYIIFNTYSTLLTSSTPVNLVIDYMKIYLAQLVNQINTFYSSNFQNDPDLKISVVFTGALIETVCNFK
jgi:hypothetical protein